MFEQIKNRIATRNIKIEIDDLAKEKIIKEGTDSNYGARPLRRAIQNMIEDIAGLSKVVSPTGSKWVYNTRDGIGTFMEF